MPQCARAPNRIRSSRVGRWRFRLRRAPVPLPGRGTEHGAGPVPGIKHRCLPSGAYAQVAAWSLRSLRAGVAAAKKRVRRDVPSLPLGLQGGHSSEDRHRPAPRQPS